jgi:hypothetical protein
VNAQEAGMIKQRKQTHWLLGAVLAATMSGAAIAGGDTPTWADALEASPNRLTAAEEANLAARAASGESAKQAPEGVYAPNADASSESKAQDADADAASSMREAERSSSSKRDADRPASTH